MQPAFLQPGGLVHSTLQFDLAMLRYCGPRVWEKQAESYPACCQGQCLRVNSKQNYCSMLPSAGSANLGLRRF